ncbi:biotin--[acetyl-CoA-carboxylase] ligase [Janibacter sp. G56]|uniref:biotin--[acetyl-CoA-carboxylase] ligase n=1 Tax=Janibacter sp. G56 TaxID=3418717 RepID=UPI003CFF521F
MRARLEIRALREALITPGSPFGEPVVLDEVDSTNLEVRRRMVPWQPVLAELQTGGRGRLGRSWEEVPRAGLAMSVLVPAPATPEWMPLIAGMAVARAVTSVAGLEADLKWPNDVLLPADGDRKTCGILCELAEGQVVVGIGINVDHTREELPVDTATSLALAGAMAAATLRETVAAACLLELARLHTALGDPTTAKGVRDTYRRLCGTVGRDVDLHQPGGRVERVRVTGIDDGGRLLVRGENGSATVAAGDVVHVRRIG